MTTHGYWENIEEDPSSFSAAIHQKLISLRDARLAAMQIKSFER